MNKIYLLFLTIIFVLFFTVSSFARGVSPYLPLKLDMLVELEIERLTTLTSMPALTKPYHIVTVNRYLDKVKKSHPHLFSRLKKYINRYKKTAALTHKKIELSVSNTDKDQKNNRGIGNDSNITTVLSGFYQFNQYFIANIGGTYAQHREFIAHQTFLSLGTEYFQLDVGFKEHWLSPLQESSTLVSTNAKPAPSITLSNVKPFTDWQIKYQVSAGILEEMQGIKFDNTVSPGKPGFLTLHASFQPFNWWTLGVNRSFIFGGGEREVNASMLWKAIIDPVSGDNCGGQSDLQDCNQELGNQVASVSSKFDFSLSNNFPISLYAELAGEDTNDYKPYLLGNKAFSLGVFLPYISQKTSLYIEHTIFEDLWYIHHIYDEGYRNDLNVIGHWWGDSKAIKDGAEGYSSTIRFNWDILTDFHLQLLVRSNYIQSSETYQYQRSKELELSLSQVYDTGFINYGLSLGQDVKGDSFYRLSLGYNW